MNQELIEKMNVLLVGDDAEASTLIEHTLREMGLMGGFHAVPDGRDALAHLQQLGDRSSWLVLLNLEMPDKAAFTFLKTIKADPMLQMIPVVVLAARHGDEAITACYELGAAGYLIKTCTDPNFAEKIRRACGYWGLSRVPVTRISNRPS